MRKILTILFFLSPFYALSQLDPGREIRITVLNNQQSLFAGATVSLLTKDSSVISTVISDKSGIALFNHLSAGMYIARISTTEYLTYHTAIIDLETHASATETITLFPAPLALAGVRVTARKPFVQFYPDKTVVNVEAGITNEGASVMEVLEKSPGVTVDRDGNISMKGKPSVQVMIDGKLTQLSGIDLQNMLNGMSASQVEVIELIDNPGAKYDAAGNAGIINIRTKKSKQRGFNGSLSSSYGQGKYPKNNNSIQLNFRSGSFNFFTTASFNSHKNFYNLYALRSYYDESGDLESYLEQDAFTKIKSSYSSIKTGVDYFAGKKTTLGFIFTNALLKRDNIGDSPATWKNEQGIADSVIQTNSLNTTRFHQTGFNFNAQHVFDAKRELSADVDFIGYDIANSQYFENVRIAPMSIPEISRGDIPTDINIFTAKADYSHHIKNMVWEAGVKTSRVSTDNSAQYYQRLSGLWEEDLGKSNHFLYTENIHAIYSSIDVKGDKKWSAQAGLRYEYTGYKARQLGNAVVKDSSFNRNYQSLFPSAFVTYEADSLNSFTLRVGRRIDRPAFQKLNPFLFIINKYTFQQGNPFFRPQYTWNIELTHVYKQVLSTSISYSYANDYFSQVFLSDTATGIIIYSEGNLGRFQNLGINVSAQVSPTSWWSFSAQATYNHKKIEGLLWKYYTAKIDQLTLNINNQFRFGKGWGAELSGIYITRNQNDIQEVLQPTGQVSAGVSKQLFKNKGTLRFTARDIFYTQAMRGMTYFQGVDEYFTLVRDTQVATLSFTFRFGKAIKQHKRTAGSANEEINRVGTGN